MANARGIMANYEMKSRLNNLKSKSEEELEKLLHEDIKEIIDLRETLSLYVTKKQRLDALELEKDEIVKLLYEMRG